MNTPIKNNPDQPLPIIGHLSCELLLRGGERQCLLLHEELLKKGFASHILCRKKSKLATKAALFITSFDYKNIFDIINIYKLNKQCKNLSISVVHCHDSRAFTLGFFLKILNPKLVLFYSRKVMFPIRNTLFNRLKFSFCTRIIAVSSAVAQVCQEITPETAISVIHDAAQADIILLSRNEARSQLGLTASHFAVGCVAYFTKEKNIDLLLKCASTFEKTNPEIKFILIGPIEKSIESLLEKRKSIISTGHMHNAIALYSAFDAYLSTSTSEGLGSALLDAIVRDIPCAAFDAGGTRDLFDNFGTPATTSEELLNQLNTIISHYPTAQKRASEHGQWARTLFSSEIFVNRHIDLYSSIIKKNSSNIHATRSI